MSKPQDGIVSRYLNRPISRVVTGVLLKFPISPNAWTMSILALPVMASVFLVRGNYIGIVTGAALFQVYSILDGCDGEIARAKNLESKFGAQLDYFCDHMASILFVVALGIGLGRLSEGIICAVLIAANECILAFVGDVTNAPNEFGDTLYSRHRSLVTRSGILHLGQRFVSLIFQLTKRDVAILFFLLLALAGQAVWILHFWLAVAAISSILAAIAFLRS